MRSALLWGLAALALLGGIGAIGFGRRPGRAVASLALCLLALAGLYAWLDAPFLALAQLLLYAALALAAWLVALERGVAAPTPEGDRQPLLKLGAAALLGLLAVKALALRAAVRPPLPEPPAGFGSARRLGALLYGDYALALAVLGVLLAAALVSAVLLARRRTDP
jgi:NADH-quinone oxidoreductase subunit J